MELIMALIIKGTYIGRKAFSVTMLNNIKN